jgi:hypothetical protein
MCESTAVQQETAYDMCMCYLTIYIFFPYVVRVTMDMAYFIQKLRYVNNRYTT